MCPHLFGWLLLGGGHNSFGSLTISFPYSRGVCFSADNLCMFRWMSVLVCLCMYVCAPKYLSGLSDFLIASISCEVSLITLLASSLFLSFPPVHRLLGNWVKPRNILQRSPLGASLVSGPSNPQTARLEGKVKPYDNHCSSSTTLEALFCISRYNLNIDLH